jgi:hypothetical protein
MVWLTKESEITWTVFEIPAPNWPAEKIALDPTPPNEMASIWESGREV